MIRYIYNKLFQLENLMFKLICILLFIIFFVFFTYIKGNIVLYYLSLFE